MPDENGISRRWVTVAALLLMLVQPALTVARLSTVHRLATIIARVGTIGSSNLRPEEVGRLVTSVSDSVPGTTCLESSIVTVALLDAQGHPSELKIGVRKRWQEFQAHAWVESNGQLIVGNDVDIWSFQVLASDNRTK